MTSMKTVQFSRGSIPCPSTSEILPLDLGGSISNEPLIPNDNQSIKRKHNPRMTIICYQVPLQVGFCFQYQLIGLVWLYSGSFSFS